jgi:alanine racemase
MSHFPRADEADKEYSLRQIERFRKLEAETRPLGVPVFHMSNSAAIFDLPGARFDLCRPGISIYGLKPSADCLNPRGAELRPVLSWRTRITQLKEVPAGTGLSYGHTFVTKRPSLIASVPTGYGDGLMRLLSNRMEFLVGGVRCRQVGTICMDQCLIDVTGLRGKVAQGDEAVLIGTQGTEEITADEMAAKAGTINYEIVTRIAQRVPRIAEEEAQ